AVNDITTYVCDLVETFISQIEEMVEKRVEEKQKAIDVSVQEITDDTKQINETLAQYQDQIRDLLEKL
ncbi:MAG: hypothetical protein J6P19_08495, partial [Acetobacter sp.]|nr:hypothetical protein [Acetobacter sp.]